MAKRKFKIPVVFTVCANMEIESDSFDEACAEAEQAGLPPKDTWSYLDGSFEVDHGPGEFQVLNEQGEWETKQILDE